MRAIQTPDGNSFSTSTSVASPATTEGSSRQQYAHQDPAAAKALKAMRKAYAQRATGAVSPVVDHEVERGAAVPEAYHGGRG
jgi:hypothetical protein